MFAAEQYDDDDDVSNIHRRWSFTRLGPSSSKASYAISLACATIIVVVSHLYYLQQQDAAGLIIFLLLGLGALTGAHYLDYLALRGTPVNKLSKVAHVSAFANLLWAMTVLLGAAADFVFAKPPAGLDYIVAGMLLAVGLRIGIFTSVFGAGTGRAIAVSFMQPGIFLFAFLPVSAYGMLAEASSAAAGLAFGAAFVALGIAWTVVADRAGRPGLSSTFAVLQAFLAAWSENKTDKMEEFTEAKAHEDVVATKILRFTYDEGGRAAIVLPDVHPGPFSTVGGSNLPYVLYEAFGRSALVMHSVSDHSLNIPSKREVDRYLCGLANSKLVQKGSTCTAPSQIRVGRSTATGIAFGDTAIVMLSLAPAGMEDVPQRVRTELESHGSSIGFSSVLVIDCHNAMGRNLSDSDRSDIVSAAKQCLDQLKKQPQQEFKVGFASLDDDASRRLLSHTGELGQAGLAVIMISVSGQDYAIGWADSNNMENGLHDHIVSKVGGAITTMLEVCTSDTHSTSGKRTREGYFALGSISSPCDIVAAYDEMCRKAAGRAARSTFELAHAQSTVKVMGKQQFEDYSSALDRSMNVTKVFLGITVATYIAMLIFS
jgi:putative membrane protein